MPLNTTTNERASFFFLGITLPVASIALREGKRSLPLSSLLLDKWLLSSLRRHNYPAQAHLDHPARSSISQA